MTDNIISKFGQAAAALRGGAQQGVGYRKGIQAINLAAEFMARGVNIQNNNNNEK